MPLDDLDEALRRQFLGDLDAVLKGEDFRVAILLALAHLQPGDPVATGLEEEAVASACLLQKDSKGHGVSRGSVVRLRCLDFPERGVT